MTAREALELATLGGARVLGRTDIDSLEEGKCITVDPSKVVGEHNRHSLRMANAAV